MMLFRTLSLRYRATEYFQQLLRELKQHRRFRQYWQGVHFQERDHFVDSRLMHYLSRQGSRLAYFYSYLTALTTAGELYLCTYVAASPETAEAFSLTAKQVGSPRVFHVDPHWPEKKLKSA
jgi:hypothetical protein